MILRGSEFIVCTMLTKVSIIYKYIYIYDNQKSLNWNLVKTKSTKNARHKKRLPYTYIFNKIYLIPNLSYKLKNKTFLDGKARDSLHLCKKINLLPQLLKTFI